jgi:hypothetical protein
MLKDEVGNVEDDEAEGIDNMEARSASLAVASALALVGSVALIAPREAEAQNRIDQPGGSGSDGGGGSVGDGGGGSDSRGDSSSDQSSDSTANGGCGS